MPTKRVNDDGTVRWDARWRDSDGKSRSKTFELKREAVRWERRQKELARTTPAGAEGRERMTVRAWAEHWLDHEVAPRVRRNDLSPTTATGYESDVRLHIIPEIGQVRLVELTAGDVTRMCTRLMDEKGLSAGTATHVKRTLSTCLTSAGQHDLVDRNAAKLARTPTVRSKVPKTFTAEELELLVADIERHSRYAPLLRFLALTGLRSSEALGLRWEDVDLDAGRYRIANTLHRIPESAARVAQPGLYEGAGKTDASRAETRLAPAAVTLLREHRKEQAEERLAAREWERPDLVWTTALGTPVYAENLRREIRRAGDATGIDTTGRKLHAFRRSFATVLLEKGTPLHIVQSLGRWSNPQMLLTRYAAPRQDAQAEALREAFGG